MLEQILSQTNYIFSGAIYTVLLFICLEIILSLIGFGFSEIINHVEYSETDFLSQSFGWFKEGIPVSIYLIIYLLTFGITGTIFQFITSELISQYIICFPIAILSLVISKYIAKIVKKIIPKDETTAVSRKSFIGKVATITIGTTKKGIPTEAKVIDFFNKTHYIIVEPIDENEFKQGDEVLITEEKGHLFNVIKIPISK